MTRMYAIVPTVDKAILELQFDFVALQNSLFGLKHVLHAGKTVVCCSLILANKKHLTTYLFIGCFSHQSGSRQ